MTRSALALLLALALTPTSHPLQLAAQEADGMRERNLEVSPIPVDTFTLDNGLHVIVSEDHSDPVVSVEIWYHVGSANEEPGRSGFAHLFEHMLFEETEHLPEGQISELLLEAGAARNGTTNQDRTAYFETLPANRVNLALWLEAERMANLVVSEKNFENQREVVKEERRQRIDNQPYSGAQLTLDTLATDYGPYEHTVIGSMDDLNAAQVDDVSRFYHQHYVPNDATLVVVGDVTVDEVQGMVQEYFGHIPRGPEQAEVPAPSPVPRTDGERRVTVDDPLAQLPLVFMAYNIPPANDEDQYALQLLSSVFSEGESSRLYQRLVKEEKAAPTVLSFLDRRKGPGLFYFGSLPNAGGDVDQIESLISEEIEKLKTDGITAQELRKAKNQRWSSDVTGRLTVSSKASDLQWFDFYYGNPFRINQDIEHFEAVTLADIQAVAQKYLTPENRTVVIAMPTGGDAATGAEGALGAGDRADREVNR